MNAVRRVVVSPMVVLAFAACVVGQYGCGRAGGVLALGRAEVVRTYEYVIDESAPFEDRKVEVTIKDAAGNELEHYTKSAVTVTHYKYSGSFVTKAIQDAYIDIGDGKEVLAKKETLFDARETPEEQLLYSPDGKTVIGAYSLNVTKSFREVSWSSEVLYTKLPCKVYEYDGRELKEVKEVPQAERGAVLGREGDINVIFADDFSRVKAVLPVTKLSEPIKKDEFEIDRVGFTSVTTAGKDELLPFVKGDLPDEEDKVRWRTVVYSKVPEEFKEAFAELTK